MSLDRRKTPEQLAQARLHPSVLPLVKMLDERPRDAWPAVIDDVLGDALITCRLDLLESLLKGGDPEEVLDRIRKTIRDISAELVSREAAAMSLEERLEEVRTELSGTRQLARKSKTDDGVEITTYVDH